MQKNERGFTLVEILIAILILGLVVVGAFNQMTHSTVGIFTAGDKSEAVFAAQGELEDAIANTAVPVDTSESITINSIPNKTSAVTIKSKTLEADYQYQGHTGKLIYVLPEKTGSGE